MALIYLYWIIIKPMNAKELIEIVMQSLEAERTGNVDMGRKLMSTDYRKTSMVLRGDVLLPRLEADDVEPALLQAYNVQGREFHVFHAAADESTQTVFIELAEVEPRPEGAIIWPYVMVCEIADGKIKRTRHYGDPALIGSSIQLSDIRDAAGR